MSKIQTPVSKANVRQKPELLPILSTATVGFLSSSRAAHSAEPGYDRLRPSVEAFRKFLAQTGIDSELSNALNLQLLPRLGLLSQIQTILNQRNDRRELAKLTDNNYELPTSQEALRYMRYATAVYGPEMIAAAQIGSNKKKKANQPDKERTTKSWISEHIHVPEQDIVLLDVDYQQDTNHDHLRHLVAVEHDHKKVVLSIRGTYNLSEIVVDITAFTTPCAFGGEAHAEIYNMAVKLWEAVGETIVKLLKENEGYNLIVTGHSLGAGCACVLNMMCQPNDRERILGRQVHCFAFACPPLFTPLEIIPQAVQSTTHYILEQDCVPFLSIDSVRHVFHCIRIMEEYRQTKMTTAERMNLALGRILPPEGMIQAVHNASGMRLEPKKGAPVLSIPAAVNVWMKEQPGGEFDFEACDSLILSWLGLNVDVQYFQYHLPPRYEHALEHLMDEI